MPMLKKNMTWAICSLGLTPCNGSRFMALGFAQKSYSNAIGSVV